MRSEIGGDGEWEGVGMRERERVIFKIDADSCHLYIIVFCFSLNHKKKFQASS